MCGIFGIVQKKPTKTLVSNLITGLERLEYRGYDSAGISFLHNSGKLVTLKKKGEVKVLRKFATKRLSEFSSIGIAHTRWATHGKPSDENAHPHADCSGAISVVHNGIIENYAEIRTQLQKNGHVFKSQTDSEVIAHLIEEFMAAKDTLYEAVCDTLKIVKGTYGLVVLHKDYPEELVCARLSSPLVVGRGKEGYFVASDPVCLGSFTKEIMFLKDREIARVFPDKVLLHKSNGDHSKVVFELQDELGGWESKGKFPHYMIKEVYDQPESLKNGLRGRIAISQGLPRLGGIIDVKKRFNKTSRVVMVGCDTSLFAGMVIEQWFEELAKIPTVTIDAGEVRNRNFQWRPSDTAIFITQSGETADLLAALRIAKQHGVLCLGLVNVVGSSVARETDAGAYLRAGPEIGVASTKAFTSQLLTGFLMALTLARARREIKKSQAVELLNELNTIPSKVKYFFRPSCISKLKRLSLKISKTPYLLYIGKWLSMPIAMEGALKMKEIAYIFSEGLSASGIKHGSLALIEKGIYSIAVAPDDKVFKSTLGNIHEVKARDGNVILVTDKSENDVGEVVDEVLTIPKTNQYFSPILSVIPLQLLAYYTALVLVRPIDKPRNLAKSVTVE